jgi:hypothetical protein
MSKGKSNWAAILLGIGTIVFAAAAADQSGTQGQTDRLRRSDTVTPSTTAVSGSADEAKCAGDHPRFITEGDSGKTFRYGGTSRFGFCLDEATYPLKSLDIGDCRSIFGYVSNWSLSGPEHYPIGFEIVGVGSCVVRNGSFHVRIVGTD